MPRGQPKTCTSCGKTHWSAAEGDCPRCRKVAPARRHAHVPFFNVLEHDVRPSPSRVTVNAGRCLAAHATRCSTHWRHLSHRHCPSVGCGRSMGARARQCGACTALELFEPQARALREIMHPEPWVDPFPGIDHYSERGMSEYHADLLGLPVTVAI